jgi:hypothetical protein
MSDYKVSTEESASLLHVIFPNYPDLQGMNVVPEIEVFLRSFREERAARSNHPPTIRQPALSDDLKKKEWS